MLQPRPHCISCSRRLVALFSLSIFGLFRAGEAASLAFTDSLPNFSDEVHARKYDIAVARWPAAGGEVRADSADFRILKSTSAEGDEFSCVVPTAPVAEANVAEEGLDQVDLPSVLLDDLTGICLVKTQEWWTYELCYQQQVRQLHKQGNDITQQFNLGNFSVNDTDVDEIHWDVGTTGTSVAFVKESYDGGSVCEVKDTHRSTEVRYTCSESGSTAIASIREVHSCSYQITVATPLICQHPAFRRIQEPVHRITCYRAKQPSDGSTSQPGASKGAVQDEIVAEVGSQPADAAQEGVQEDQRSQEGGTGVRQEELQIDLDTLSEEAMDELVSNMMRQGLASDPDIDFLGLIDSDYDGESGTAGAGGSETTDDDRSVSEDDEGRHGWEKPHTSEKRDREEL